MATILLIEDDATVARLLGLYLKKLGHQVDVCASAQAALAAFDARRHQLVFTDLTLEGMSGEDVLRQLRQSVPDLPAIIASGYPYEPQLPGVRFLQKPFLPRLLEETIAALLAG